MQGHVLALTVIRLSELLFTDGIILVVEGTELERIYLEVSNSKYLEVLDKTISTSISNRVTYNLITTFGRFTHCFSGDNMVE